MTADTPIPTDPSIDGRSAGGSSGTPQVGRRIGLFGGTFDPVHHGHLAAAWNVRQILDLDEIWLVVANDPWQKSGDRTITSASTRLEWVRQAVRAFDGLEASDVEIESGGASYTVDTIAVLREQHPEVSWSVIVGTDVVADLDTWHRADELREAIEIVAVQRPGSGEAQAPAGWTVRNVGIPPVDLSSTQLRALASTGRLLHFLVPAEVANDIAASGVYDAGGEAVNNA